MTRYERRINVAERPEKCDRTERPDPLKEIAGRISNLNYRDMVRLAEFIEGHVRPAKDVPAALLRMADEILDPDKESRL